MTTTESKSEKLNLTQSLLFRNSCPICANPSTQKEIAFDGFEISYCSHCQLRFQSAYLNDDMMDRINKSEELRDFYFPECAHYFDIPNREAYIQGMSPRWKSWLEFAEKSVKGRKLLDLGCGTGEFLSFAQVRGWNVSGVDYDPENTAKVRDLFHIPCETGDLTKWEGNRSGPDMISLFDVLEHFIDPNRILEVCHRELNDDGLLLIAVPNDRNFLSILARWFSRLSFGAIKKPARLMYEFDHRSFFSPAALKTILKKNKFKVVRVFLDETNLSRLELGFLTKRLLNVIFFFSRLFGFQNRVLVFAKKDIS